MAIITTHLCIDVGKIRVTMDIYGTSMVVTKLEMWIVLESDACAVTNIIKSAVALKNRGINAQTIET